MKIKTAMIGTFFAVSSMFGMQGTAGAADILCELVANNHMLVDDVYVSSCVDAGIGNIGQGNQANDDFLNQLPPGHGYSTIGDQTFAQTGSTGTFSIDPTQWNNFADLFVGFKFGTGNKPDEWFVYELQDNVSSGNWEFVNVGGTGGGLSHVSLYGKGSVDPDPDGPLPEPASLALVGVGLVLASLTRRRRSI